MTEHTFFWALTALRLLTVVLAGMFLWFVLRAYVKHHVTSLLILFIAMGLMTAGAVVEGLLVGFMDVDLDIAHTVEAVFQLVAFAVLVWSVMAHQSGLD